MRVSQKVLSRSFPARPTPTTRLSRCGDQASNAVVDDGRVLPATSMARHQPARSVVGIQHQLGADIMFAFGELTSLPAWLQSRESLERTCAMGRAVSGRAQAPHAERSHKPYQQLWGVIRVPSGRTYVARQRARWPTWRWTGQWLRRLRRGRALEGEPGHRRVVVWRGTR